jgi:hypothetical protein
MLSFILMLASTTHAPIFVGKFDPAEFPNAQKVERRMPHADLNNRIERILGSHQCSLDGQNKRKFDIVVPYAVLMDPSGKPSKVVVKDIGCAPIERLVGEIGSELANAGDFKTSHETGDHWYVSEAYFTRLNEEQTRNLEDPDRVVCKKDRPKKNSHIAMAKTCMTVAQWQVYEKDRDQMKRDLVNIHPRTGGQ